MNHEVYQQLLKEKLWKEGVTYEDVVKALEKKKEDVSGLLWAGIFVINIAAFGLLAAIAGLSGLDSLGIAIYALVAITIWLLLCYIAIQKAEKEWNISDNSIDSLWTIACIVTAPWGTAIGAIVSSLGGPFDMAFALIPVTIATIMLLIKRSRTIEKTNDGFLVPTVLSVWLYFFWIIYILSKNNANYNVISYVHLILSGMLYIGSIIIPQDKNIQLKLKGSFGLNELNMKLIYFSPKLSAIYYGFAGVFFVLQIANSYQITDLRYWIDIICIILFGIVPPLILFIKATIPTPSAAGVAYIIVWAIIILLTSNLPSIIAWILNLIIAGIGLYVLIRVSVGKSVNICCCKFISGNVESKIDKVELINQNKKEEIIPTIEEGGDNTVANDNSNANDNGNDEEKIIETV